MNNIILGNYFNKHQSKNPVYRLLVNNYKNTLQKLLIPLEVNNVYEVGSGEGYILSYINEVNPMANLFGMDVDVDLIKNSKKQNSIVHWSVAMGEKLPVESNSFDLVVVCEVLEHVIAPEILLQEIKRVTNKYVLISVPREPDWRILNLIRFKYWQEFGNTPGHVNHWTSAGIVELVNAYFQIMRVKVAYPWTFVLAKSNKFQTNP